MTEFTLQEALQRVATGPHLSKDLSREEACQAMQPILSGTADPVQAGIFFIALRMKRESDAELAGILDAIHAVAPRYSVACDEVFVLTDPYDGFLRGTPAGPFLPAVLAALGLPTLTHGVARMGPKFGVTHEAVLARCGIATQCRGEHAAEQLSDPSAGWGYVDQRVLCPALADLANLRTRIVKRPCLTTLDVALNVFQPRRAAHLVTGYVHKAYPPIYAALAAHAGFASATLVRGVEGGVVPSLSQDARYFFSQTGLADDLQRMEIAPSQLTIETDDRAIPLPAYLVPLEGSAREQMGPEAEFVAGLAQHAATLGSAALQGEAGLMRQSIQYAAAIVLCAQGRASSLPAAADDVAAVLDDGSAWRRFSRLFAAP